MKTFCRVTSLLLVVALLLNAAPAFQTQPAVVGTIPGAVATGSAQSESDDKKSSPAPPPVSREFKIKPFNLAGEKLTYEVKFSRFPIYATVGEITFEMIGKAPETLPNPVFADLQAEFKSKENESLIHLRATAFAKGFLIKLFGVSAQDRFESLIDEKDFSARLSFKRIQEGKRNQSLTTIFEPDKQAAKYTVYDFNKPQEAPKETELKPTLATLDLLAAIYFLRFQKLKNGETIFYPVNDDGQQYEFEIFVSKREKLEYEGRKVNTIRIEPKLFGPGRLLSKAGEMTMWLTDDDRRVPLKLVAKTSTGTVTANLVRDEKTRAALPKKSNEQKLLPDQRQ